MAAYRIRNLKRSSGEEGGFLRVPYAEPFAPSRLRVRPLPLPPDDRHRPKQPGKTLRVMQNDELGMGVAAACRLGGWLPTVFPRRPV
jgi:hypothetical protein